MKHIVERAIVPHNPSASSIINKEQYNLYAPVAGQGKVGMAAFDLRDFEVKNQTVFLHANIRESIDKVSSLEADIIENTANIETNRANIATNASDIEINRTNIATNTGNIATNTGAIENIRDAISALEDFDTTHKAEFDAFVEAVNDLLDMDDETLDQYHEVLALIKSNRDTLQYIGTNKIDKDKIADDLKTMSADHVLSANQGVVLKRLITALENALNTEVANRESAVTSEENARKAAITAEANARALADATHTADISTLKTRLDGLDLPIIQKSLYEHNISIYSFDPAESIPDGDYAIFRCTLYLPFEETIHFNETVGAIQTFQGKEFGTDGERVDVLVGSYSGAVTIKNYDGTFTTYPIDEAVVFDDNVWSLQLNYAGGGAYTLRNETATTYDVVRVIADVAESGGGGNAIVECLTLPTENISVTHFYRTPDGRVHWNDGTNWHVAAEEEESVSGYDFTIRANDFTTEYLETLGIDGVTPKTIYVSGELVGTAANPITREVTVPYGVSEIRIDISSKDYFTLNVRNKSYYGVFYPTKLIVGGSYGIDSVTGFTGVEVKGDSYSNVGASEFISCKHIDGLLNGASRAFINCTNITNVRCKGTFTNCSVISDIYISGTTTFDTCAVISNVYVGGTTTFSSCSFLSNIRGTIVLLTGAWNVTYTNCTNVDSETCIGYASTSSGSTSGGYFEGTAAEYNEAADTVPVGAIVWLTDEEGNLTTAVLDKAILGQMILGTS